MMYHHGKRDYEIAAAEATGRARDNFESLINNGPQVAGRAVAHMLREQPLDSVVPAPALNFYRNSGAIGMEFFGQDHRAGDLHPHARGQVIDLSQIGRRWANRVAVGADWEQELLVHNLNTIFQHRKKRQLIRMVERPDETYEVRGVLSDSYKRMDATGVIQAFIEKCESLGAVPVEAIYTGTRIAVKMLIKTLFSPVPGEVMAIGAVLQTSDFGNGALTVRCFILRPWCTNFAIGDDTLRKIHSGSKLQDDIAWSDKTRDLDLKAVISQIEDIVDLSLSAQATDRVCLAIKEAHDTEVSPLEITSFLNKKLGNKEQVKEVMDAYTSADILNLPPGQNRWRLSNAISWIGGQVEDKETKLNLQRAAGEAMSLTAIA